MGERGLGCSRRSTAATAITRSLGRAATAASASRPASASSSTVGRCGHQERRARHARDPLQLRGHAHQLDGVAVGVASNQTVNGRHGSVARRRSMVHHVGDRLAAPDPGLEATSRVGRARHARPVPRARCASVMGASRTRAPDQSTETMNGLADGPRGSSIAADPASAAALAARSGDRDRDARLLLALARAGRDVDGRPLHDRDHHHHDRLRRGQASRHLGAVLHHGPRAHRHRQPLLHPGRGHGVPGRGEAGRSGREAQDGASDRRACAGM